MLPGVGKIIVEIEECLPNRTARWGFVYAVWEGEGKFCWLTTGLY